jgi:hypothetical protein
LLDSSQHPSPDCVKNLNLASAEEGNIDPYSLNTKPCNDTASLKLGLGGRYVSAFLFSCLEFPLSNLVATFFHISTFPDFHFLITEIVIPFTFETIRTQQRAMQCQSPDATETIRWSSMMQLL